MPKFTVIMQCFLGDYHGAASNRKEKLIRAVDSVLAQTFTDWEMIIVADGCDETFNIIEKNYSKESRIDCFLIPKQPIWTGTCRNIALKNATGEWAVYLDADDFFGPNHLEIINKNTEGLSWMWFNDKVLNDKAEHIERRCSIDQKFQHGTSNIAHKLSLGAMWTSGGYGYDDWGLVQHLKKISLEYKKVETSEYIVCHIPKMLDL